MGGRREYPEMPFLINTPAHVEIMSDLLPIWQDTEAKRNSRSMIPSN